MNRAGINMVVSLGRNAQWILDENIITCSMWNHLCHRVLCKWSPYICFIEGSSWEFGSEIGYVRRFLGRESLRNKGGDTAMGGSIERPGKAGVGERAECGWGTGFEMPTPILGLHRTGRKQLWMALEFESVVSFSFLEIFFFFPREIKLSMVAMVRWGKKIGIKEPGWEVASLVQCVLMKLLVKWKRPAGRNIEKK